MTRPGLRTQLHERSLSGFPEDHPARHFRVDHSALFTWDLDSEFHPLSVPSGKAAEVEKGKLHVITEQLFGVRT